MGVVLWGSFLYGAAIHLLLLRGYVAFAYRPPADTTFVNHPLTNLGFSILGGISVACFMRALFREALAAGGLRLSRAILKGGFYGISATFIAFQALYVVTAVVLARSASAENGNMTLLETFLAMLLGLMSIQLYGMGPVVYSLPFAFAYGAIAGVCVERIARRAPASAVPGTTTRPTRLATISFVLGILGLLLYWTPLPGGLFNILAVALGVQGLRQARKGLAAGKLRAIFGIVFGIAGLAALAEILFSQLYPRGGN